MADLPAGRNQGSFHRGFSSPGVNNVGSYQVSGTPFITGSSIVGNQTHVIKFPFVTKAVTVIQSGSAGALRVHFNPRWSSENVMDFHHYITLDSDEDAVTFNAKCTEIYVTGVGASGYELIAELTHIPSGSMYSLTGSGLTNNSGMSEQGYNTIVPGTSGL